MNAAGDAPLFKAVSVSALCMAHDLDDSARLGWAMRQAVEQHYGGTVAFLASGSLSHRFAQNGLAPAFAFKVWSPFLEQLDTAVLRLWQQGDWRSFCAMLPEYAAKGHGEGSMHDTAMLLGALGWSDYDAPAEPLTPYFGASGTGQVNAIFPVTPQSGAAVPQPVASRRGRSAATLQAVGQALGTAVKAHFAPALAQHALGLTLQIDEGHEVFDAKLGNLHAVFGKS
jgi:3,4-dihydroxyphenylacetate 2,3-dioxygenase